MKKNISLILVLCMALALLAGCGSSNSSNSSDPSDKSNENEDASFELDTTDLLTEHTVFLMDDGGDYREYHIIYYGNDTHGLKKMSIQIQFDKAGGITEEHLNEYDVEEAYPGFNSFSFANKQVVDDGDFYTLILNFEDLDNMDNVDAMEANGIITTEDNDAATMVDADSYMDSLRSIGGVEVGITDDAYLTLHY